MYTKTADNGNKIFIKGIVTGVLILLLLIPAYFVNNLVAERQTRQETVTKQVSSKWAGAQTLSGPYIIIPYTVPGSIGNTTQYLTLLPESLRVEGLLLPEKMRVSIYQVLLYRSKLNLQGSFRLSLPAQVPAASLQWTEARVYVGLNDIKGVEEKPRIRFNNNSIDCMPGLPVKQLDSTGFSAPLTLAAADLDKPLAFNMDLALKGSGGLHFIPLAGDSRFTLRSTWTKPSFDGNSLPATRNVSNSGFSAAWTFNQANLPFGTVLTDAAIDKNNFAFGVSMIQQTGEDQYAKTMRCTKYAVLFIGLTFALFFIIELLQQKAFHPVQYVLVGLALIVFYTLLLSISEFMAFDTAYVLAAAAVIALVSLYAKGHFNKWSTAGFFAFALTVLYGFIFVIIRLEDTALLAGSLGLFIILAIIMYFSRKIKWYPETSKLNQL